MKRTCLASFLGLILSGCATMPRPPATEARYQQMLDTWKGADINKLIYSWGPPTSTFTMPNADRMYTWANVKVGPTTTTGRSAAYYAPNSVTGQFQSNKFSAVSFTPTWDCYSTAITNSSGTVQSWKVKGNTCVMGYTDKELAENYQIVKTHTLELKKPDGVKIRFYDGAQEPDRVWSGSIVGFFEGYDKLNDTIHIHDHYPWGWASAGVYLHLSSIESLIRVEEPAQIPEQNPAK